MELFSDNQKPVNVKVEDHFVFVPLSLSVLGDNDNAQGGMWMS